MGLLCASPARTWIRKGPLGRASRTPGGSARGRTTAERAVSLAGSQRRGGTSWPQARFRLHGECLSAGEHVLPGRMTRVVDGAAPEEPPQEVQPGDRQGISAARGAARAFVQNNKRGYGMDSSEIKEIVKEKYGPIGSRAGGTVLKGTRAASRFAGSRSGRQHTKVRVLLMTNAANLSSRSTYI